MIRNIQNQTLALAGLFQAAGLVQQIAHQGTVDDQFFEATIGSVFQTDPPTVPAVYGGAHNLGYGLKLLLDELQRTGKERNLELIKYVVTLLHLERQLAKKPDLQNKISEGIEQARAQSAHFSITHDNVVARLAATYKDTISTLTPRIMVSGAHGLLEHPDVTDRVRALLLAAIRSAVLWRQCGGSRLRLFFARGNIAAAAKTLLAQAVH